MAIMNQESIAKLDGVTPGEILVFNLLRELLPDNCYVWYDVMIKDRYPDFVVLCPNLGIIILEVKDWEIGSIISADSENFTLRTSGRTPQNPLKQAKLYMRLLVNILNKHDQLKEKRGKYKGNSKFNYGYGVILSQISESDFIKRGFTDSIPSRYVIFKDKLDQLSQARDKEQLFHRLHKMIPTELRLPDISSQEMEIIKATISKVSNREQKNEDIYERESHTDKNFKVHNNYEIQQLDVKKEKKESKFVRLSWIIFVVILAFAAINNFFDQYVHNKQNDTGIALTMSQNTQKKSGDVNVEQKAIPLREVQNSEAARTMQNSINEKRKSASNEKIQENRITTGNLHDGNKISTTQRFNGVREGVWIKGNISKNGDKIYHIPTQRYYTMTKAEEWFSSEGEAIKAGYRKAKDIWIKGNINARGEKIYHMPGQQYYEKTRPEEWFETEEDAIAAGYRRSRI